MIPNRPTSWRHNASRRLQSRVTVTKVTRQQDDLSYHLKRAALQAAMFQLLIRTQLSTHYLTPSSMSDEFLRGIIEENPSFAFGQFMNVLCNRVWGKTRCRTVFVYQGIHRKHCKIKWYQTVQYQRRSLCDRFDSDCSLSLSLSHWTELLLSPNKVNGWEINV